ncbi:MAG: hypothetical protein A3H61_05075 [Candidatus Jacksonbacteria bacterium RIFCSPLOWO2_02_FULL_44_20]|uniref:Uncharacterized protein n=1 Tax=Candidatus Jacksonbacteria bacterium RIFCSPLOWO2_02_FULL_44_20 TaxID=1798460 RepID=A0A1G2A7R9_9BACT|nr:MAG: hypothetical protein A3E05_02205 [Candidatus Jacksonbacteria bacterium RIFCSPHIGHO2_12_FULL_44_12]OGY72725.1 MAG: hypothetical protein A3H61_05075 [Candidatus Jacksonbacteria bacterium RIFCSPLOWO2_02_FULL_44_20]OGY72924.1 MAG: hypothetical protein A3H07_05265 [Candidatus Jacksonbacteria bacterium RIFCSPLOWO2_12_FULL_44_15b]HCA67665.1 hypothetical protein [Candidatus Jacksonbacteria bacterium]HCE86955.1 hypothetical protein [Candidatus Jacksonbacteria bacterium]
MKLNLKTMPANQQNTNGADVLDLFDEATLAEIPVTDAATKNLHGTQSSPDIDNDAVYAFASLPSHLQSAINKDAELKKRFESILATYLKDIRDELETRDRLSASIEKGGMGFAFDDIEEIFKSLLEPKTQKLESPSLSPIRQLKPAVALKPLTLSEFPETEELRSFSITPIDLKKIDKPVAMADRPKIPQPPKSDDFTNTASAFSSRRSAPTGGAKPIMVDISHPSSRLVNPTDEFATFDFEDMRRSGVGKFIDFVVDRIEKISRDEFANRRSAIRAWQRSPLYRKYVAIGKEVLKSASDVSAYLKEHSLGLTCEEFEMIGKLNERLRF